MIWLGRLLGRGIDITTVIACAAVVFMMAQIAVDVTGRYIFNTSMPATIAMVANYYMVMVAFLPLALTERRNDHISVELVATQMPLGMQRHLYAWTHLFSGVVLGFLAYAGWIEATTKHAISAFIIERGIRVPVWPSYYLLPLGCGMMSLVLLYRFLTYLFSSRSGLGETPVIGDEYVPPEAGLEHRE